jgi:hypothetical protein
VERRWGSSCRYYRVGALAQIMPDAFQITREKHHKAMSVVFGTKSIWIAVMIVGCLLGWYIWNLEDRIGTLATSLNPKTTVIGTQDETGLNFVGWTADQSKCFAQIDLSKVPESMKAQFDVALVCGFTDPAIDLLKDTRITASRLFTIQTVAPVVIAAPFSKGMADALDSEQETAIKNIQPPPRRGTLVTMQNQIWIKMILLPKGFDISSIRKLEDVRSAGGKISDRLAAVSILKNVPAK